MEDLLTAVPSSSTTSQNLSARRKATIYRKFTVEQLGVFYNSITDVMNAVGSFGKYQIFCCFVLFYSSVLWTADYAFMSFGFMDTDWRCDRTGTPTTGATATVPINGTSSPSPLFLRDNETLFCQVYQTCSALTPLNYQFYTVVEDFQLICDRKFDAVWLFTGYLGGHFLGACFGGLGADLFGRLFGFFATLAIALVSNVMSIASQSWRAFVAFQVVNGLVMGKIEVNSLTLFLEFTEESYRLVPIAVYQSGVAFLVVSLIAFLTAHWRYYFIIVGLVSAPLMYLHLVFEESPRWLIISGKKEKAAKVLSEIASDRWNNKQLTIVPAQLNLAHHRIRKTSSFTNIIRTYRRVLFLLVQILSSFTWGMVNSFLVVTMGSRVVGVHLHLLIQGLIRLAIPLAVITAFYKTSWSKSKYYLIFSLLLEAVSFGIIIASLLAKAKTNLLVIFWMEVLATIANSGIYRLFLIDIIAVSYPTAILSTMLGVVLASCDISAIATPFLVNVFADQPYIPFVIAEVFIIVTLVLSVFVQPETKFGKTARLFPDFVEEEETDL